MRGILETYSRGGELHVIELRPDGSGGRELVDRCQGGPTVLVAELAYDEGEQQALAVLHGDGAYLERARAGERGLGAHLEERRAARPAPPAKAA